LTAIKLNTTGATGIGISTNLPSGVTASWSGNEKTIIGTPSSTGTFPYSIPLSGGCGSVNATGTNTLTPAPHSAAAARSTQTVTALTNIKHVTTSATGIGTATDLPAGVSAAWSNNIITIRGISTATGTFNYTILLTGTSCSSVNATGIITVNPVCLTATNVDYNNINTYYKVPIGSQYWMKENLRTRLCNNGTEILFDATVGSVGSSPTW